jgi:hypothetical protein
MSPEDVAREAQDRGEAVAADAAAASSATPNAESIGNVGDGAGFSGVAMASGYDKGKDAAGHHHHSGWSGNLRHRGGASGSGGNNNSGIDSSSNVSTVHRAAEYEAQKTSPVNETETTQTTVPIGNGTVLPGLVVGGPSSSSALTLPSLPSLPSMSSIPSMPTSSPPAPPHNDRRESMQQPALPIVDEANENSSTGGRSRSSRFSSHTTESDYRPATPAKDVPAVPGQYGVRLSGGSARNSPPTPPTTGYLKPESADSGYGVSGTRSRSGTVGSGRKVKMQLSRDSLEKELPPLPKLDGTA